MMTCVTGTEFGRPSIRTRVRAALAAFARADDGAALAEYAVVLATLSVLMIGVLGYLAARAGSNLTSTQTGMTSWSQTY